MRINTINSVILVCAFELLVSQVPASADMLQASYECGSAATISQTASPLSGPLNASMSCSGYNIASGSLFVNPLPGSMGSSVSFGGRGLVQVDTTATDTLSISSSTLPIGTLIALTAVDILSGTYSYSVPAGGSVYGHVIGDVNLYNYNGGLVGGFYDSAYNLHFCSPTLTPVSCEGTLSVGGSGSLSVPLVSGPFYTTIGAQVSLKVVEEQDFSGPGSFTGDFVDPVTFTVTDPGTGAVLSGITITGDTGSYDVNPTSAPEPSSLGLLALPVLALIAVRMRAPHCRLSSRVEITPSSDWN